MEVTRTIPDGHMPDGTPVYIMLARGNCKTNLQMEVYRRLLGIPDDEWEEIKRKTYEKLEGESYDQNQHSED